MVQSNNHKRNALLIFLAIFLLTAVACRQPSTPTTSTQPVGETATDRIKILVESDGFIRANRADLAAAGLEMAAFDAANLRLTSDDTAVPFHLTDDSLIFYGQAPTSPYTAQRAYLLTSGAPGQTMTTTAVPPPDPAAPTASAITRTLRLEENLIYESQARQTTAVPGNPPPPPDQDIWFWQPFRQGNTLPFTFDLPLVADGSGEIRIQVKGVTYNRDIENDHDFDIILNGQNLGTIRFDGQIYHTGHLSVPPGLLRSGSNELVLDNAVAGAAPLDIMNLNWIEITYATPTQAIDDQLTLHGREGQVTLAGFSAPPLLFDLTDPAAPQLLTGADTTVPTTLTLTNGRPIAAIGPNGFHDAHIQPIRANNWRSPDNGADLLIITTDELAPALDPLIAARTQEGLRVTLVPVAEIYDEFGGGAATPDSIQTFVSYAYHNWTEPPPRYLFLVGDATSDYRNYLGLSPAHIIPAPMVEVAFSGETVSDSRLADVDGDMVPDLAVGRWPVNSIAEVESLVARTLAYETGTAVDQAIFATDATESQFADIARRLGSGSGLNDEQIALLTGPAATDILNQWQQGTWLTTYIGHGSLTQWGKENIFTLDAVSELQGETPPIVLQLTCLTGLFNHPEQPSLAEQMLHHDQGPVLQVAATSLTLSSHQEPFAASLLNNLRDPAVLRIGDAFQNAKLSLDIASNNGLREISDTFALLGDPSARIVRPNS